MDDSLLGREEPIFLPHFLGYGPPRLTILVVDLMKLDVWLTCRQIRDHYSDLKELGLVELGLVGRFNMFLKKDHLKPLLEPTRG